MSTMTAPWTKTACPYCGVGCGVLARSAGDGKGEIRGDSDHPANFGRLCSKGSALAETLSLDDRLLHPIVKGQRASWDRAISLVAERFSATIAEHGPDSVALYVSGQLLTEDYYVANKLMKGFIGSANIDTNSRLCMASSVAGHRRAFGSDTVPGNYEDLELADLVVLVGSNLAWCHPVLFQRLAAARDARGTKIVVVDPRRTATCEIADLHLAIRPGSDVALFNGLLGYLAAAGLIDRDYVGQHTVGLDQALAAAATMNLQRVAEATGIAAAEIADFYELFAANECTVTAFSQGVNQSSAGTDKVNAIINCHLATGRIGRPGMGPFSITGQPNAMGGRETGGLANMLAAHMELDNPNHRRIVQSFWGSPHIASKPGLKAVDLFRAVADGRIKALWIMATNPADSLPQADEVVAALSMCPFVVVSDVTAHTDTAQHAHVLLPAAAWGEKDGTVTNSERRITRQRSFLALPGEVRPDWWQLAAVAQRMGHEAAFDYTHSSQIFAEYAALTSCENGGMRDLDLGAFVDITADHYDALTPTQWPSPAGSANGVPRLFANGGFFTPDRRARFVATPFRQPAQQTSERFPLVLNTGRLRDQWHTMTRTAKAPRLMTHAPDPVLEINPDDAADLDLGDGTIAEVEGASGVALLRVATTDAQRRGTVFAPMHWTGQLTSASRIGPVVGAATDPVSGQPELKHTAVAVRRYEARWYGFAVVPTRPSLDTARYVAAATVERGYRLELADKKEPDSWDEYARRLLCGSMRDTAPPYEVLAYHDRALGQHRFATFLDGRLSGALFVSRAPLQISRSWAVERLGEETTPADRLRLLAGRPGAGAKDRGPIVCACYEIGRNEITAAVIGGCTSVALVGELLRAGTNCGSCRSEIKRIIDESSLQKAG
jgi:assimilatory nitrate reductase catalytic subunit